MSQLSRVSLPLLSQQPPVVSMSQLSRVSLPLLSHQPPVVSMSQLSRPSLPPPEPAASVVSMSQLSRPSLPLLSQQPPVVSNLSHPSLPPQPPDVSMSQLSRVSLPLLSQQSPVVSMSQSFLPASHGGATGPGLKSRSCLTASGIGGRVSLALGSALPRGTGRACFSRVALPSVPHTGAGSCAPHWLGPGRPLLPAAAVAGSSSGRRYV